MPLHKLLIANRGEIAIRVARAAAELGIATLAVHSEDDADALHVRRADESAALTAFGPAAYLDIERIVAVAVREGCDALHPGYGFLSENPALARRCAESGIVFVGASPELLELFGDKLAARALARRCNVPVLPGTEGAITVDEARAFLASLGEGGAMMIKAIAGGGGRGLRAVHRDADVAAAYARCTSEAVKAFGNGALYAEALLERARHVEIQLVGDGSGAAVALGERECSLQRRHQKLIEIAPSPSVSPALRDALMAAALRMAGATCLRGLATIEFLIELDAAGEGARWFFIEANPRLQVEHTVTEMVTGVDLVQTQLRIAAGEGLAELGLTEPPAPRGRAMQLRVNLESARAQGGALPVGDADGADGADGADDAKPADGTIRELEWPGGPGIRIDGALVRRLQAEPALRSAARQAGRAQPVAAPRRSRAQGAPCARRSADRWRADESRLPARVAGSRGGAGEPDRYRVCRARSRGARRRRPALGALPAAARRASRCDAGANKG